MNEKYFVTTDLYLACFLSCEEQDCEVIKKENNQCGFKFIKSEKLDSDINNYYNNGKVNVLDFKNKLRDKKSEIINITRS
jgi:hypothetical protein